MLLASDVTSSASGDGGSGGTTSIDWDALWQTIVHWLATNGLRLLIGLVVLFIAFKLINVIAKSIRKRMEKRQVEITIRHVTYSAIRVGLKVLVLIAFLGFVGIDTAGLAAAVASISVGIGLALQGSLSNFAGGIVILVMRPFKIGDYITAQGESGTVEDIHPFYTNLVTPDNKVIMIPNGILANGVIVNVNMKDKRRVDLTFSIHYASDIAKAKAAILSACGEHDLVLKTIDPFIRVNNYGDSSIDLVVRVWANTADYWTVYFDLMEKIKVQFDLEGIEIPYPQLDVHVQKDDPHH